MRCRQTTNSSSYYSYCPYFSHFSTSLHSARLWTVPQINIHRFSMSLRGGSISSLPISIPHRYFWPKISAISISLTAALFGQLIYFMESLFRDKIVQNLEFNGLILERSSVMFDWTAEITGTGDRSEFKLETVLESTIWVVTEDTVIEALVPTFASLRLPTFFLADR